MLSEPGAEEERQYVRLRLAHLVAIVEYALCHHIQMHAVWGVVVMLIHTFVKPVRPLLYRLQHRALPAKTLFKLFPCHAIMLFVR